VWGQDAFRKTLPVTGGKRKKALSNAWRGAGYRCSTWQQKCAEAWASYAGSHRRTTATPSHVTPRTQADSRNEMIGHPSWTNGNQLALGLRFLDVKSAQHPVDGAGEVVLPKGRPAPGLRVALHLENLQARRSPSTLGSRFKMPRRRSFSFFRRVIHSGGLGCTVGIILVHRCVRAAWAPSTISSNGNIRTRFARRVVGQLNRWHRLVLWLCCSDGKWLSRRSSQGGRKSALAFFTCGLLVQTLPQQAPRQLAIGLRSGTSFKPPHSFGHQGIGVIRKVGRSDNKRLMDSKAR
jgi:hypothetical protein